jgi:hypothetical protein
MPWWQKLAPIILIMPDLMHALQACKNSTVCPASAPFCLSYANNKTLTQMRDQQQTQANLFISSDQGSNLDFVEGFCVQCREDCDCGVNEFCGVDPDASTRVTFPNISMEMLPAITPTRNFTQV